MIAERARYHSLLLAPRRLDSGLKPAFNQLMIETVWKSYISSRRPNRGHSYRTLENGRGWLFGSRSRHRELPLRWTASQIASASAASEIGAGVLWRQSKFHRSALASPSLQEKDRTVLRGITLKGIDDGKGASALLPHHILRFTPRRSFSGSKLFLPAPRAGMRDSLCVTAHKPCPSADSVA